MKIRLAVSKEKTDEVRDFLLAHGIELDDDADLILTEKSKHVSRLPLRDAATGEKVYLPVENIVFLESFGHEVYVHTDGKDYVTSDPLYQVQYLLDPVRFLRVSVSVIVARTHIREIKPTLSRKFVLVLSNGSIVDVTRSYYNAFKAEFGI